MILRSYISAGYTARKFCYKTWRHRCSLDCSTWQSEWGFVPSNVGLLLLQTALQWREWKAYCCIAKQETCEVSKHAGRLQNSYSWGTWVLNWVKWPERASDHQP